MQLNYLFNYIKLIQTKEYIYTIYITRHERRRGAGAAGSRTGGGPAGGRRTHAAGAEGVRT